jgi:hypothetical protein
MSLFKKIFSEHIKFMEVPACAGMTSVVWGRKRRFRPSPESNKTKTPKSISKVNHLRFQRRLESPYTHPNKLVIPTQAGTSLSPTPYLAFNNYPIPAKAGISLSLTSYLSFQRKLEPPNPQSHNCRPIKSTPKVVAFGALLKTTTFGVGISV